MLLKQAYCISNRPETLEEYSKMAEEVLEEIVLEDAAPVEDAGSAAPAIADAADSLLPERENRQHQRFRVNLTVFIRLSSGELARAHAVDLSMGGVYIEYGAPADKDKEFEMAFDLPFRDDFQRVLVKAKVVRSIVIGSRNVYGLAFIFTEFAKDTDQVLAKYLELRDGLCG